MSDRGFRSTAASFRTADPSAGERSRGSARSGRRPTTTGSSVARPLPPRRHPLGPKPVGEPAPPAAPAPPSAEQPQRPTPTAHPSLLRSASIVGTAFVASRALGLLREMMIASRFGTSGEVDAYVAAFRIPDLLFLVIMAGAFGSAFIPVFAGMLERRQVVDAWRLASAVLNLSAIAMVVAAAITFVLAEPVMEYLLLPGYDPELQQLGAELTRLLLLSPILLGLGIAAKGILEAQHRFTLPALAPLLYNLGIIVGILVFTDSMGIKGVAIGVVIGAAAHVLVQVPGLIASGMRYVPHLRLDTPGLDEVGRLLMPRVLGQAAFQLNFIVVTLFAAKAGEERLSALNYGWQLLMLPHGVIALSISTVVFPSLARLYVRRDLDGLRATFGRALKPLLFLSIPAAIALFAFRDGIVQVLLERGEFDEFSRTLTTDALAYFALGLVAYAVVEVMTRVFYGMHDTRTPVIAGVTTIGVNIVLCAVLVEPMGVSGLALSLSLTTAAELVILVVVLKRRLGTLVPGFGDWLFRTFLASLSMAGVVAVLAEPLSEVTVPGVAPFLVRVAFLGFAFALALGTYVGAAWFVGLAEPRDFLARLGPRFAPRGRP